MIYPPMLAHFTLLAQGAAENLWRVDFVGVGGSCSFYRPAFLFVGKSLTFLEMEAQLRALCMVDEKTTIRARAGEDGQVAVPFVCLIFCLFVHHPLIP